MPIMIVVFFLAARCDERALEIDSSTPESAFAVFFLLSFIHIFFLLVRWEWREKLIMFTQNNIIINIYSVH